MGPTKTYFRVGPTKTSQRMAQLRFSIVWVQVSPIMGLTKYCLCNGPTTSYL